MKTCYVCNETENMTQWEHPVTNDAYTFCGYCRSTIVGVCAECNHILFKIDPIGVNHEGQRICYKCSAMHEMEDSAEG